MCRFQHKKPQQTLSSASSTRRSTQSSLSPNKSQSSSLVPKQTRKPNSFADAIGRPDNNNNKPTSSSSQNSTGNLRADAQAFVPIQQPIFNTVTALADGMTTIHLSGDHLTRNTPVVNEPVPIPADQKIPEFCPEHRDTGYCSFGNIDACHYQFHGEQCPICTLYLIKPNDPTCRHLETCNKEHEDELEEACKEQDSERQVCTVCMDVVWEKQPPSQQRFGILENCDHVFCLACIREWRATKSADSTAIRGCPECRLVSNFIIPSKYFVTKEPKELLIANYKIALSQKECMHFNRGKGDCPFGISCFYKHQYEDGSLQDRSQRQPIRYNLNGQVIDLRPSHPLFDMLREELSEGGRLQQWQQQAAREHTNASAQAVIDDLDYILDGLLEAGIVTSESEYDEEDYIDDQIGSYYVD